MPAEPPAERGRVQAAEQRAALPQRAEAEEELPEEQRPGLERRAWGREGRGELGRRRALRGSFSAVSKPMFASKYPCKSS